MKIGFRNGMALALGVLAVNTAGAELAANGSFTLVQPLKQFRKVHTATRLTSGEVLVAGGFNTSDTGPTTELFDPASVVATPPLLNLSAQPNGALQITFRNTPGLSFTALTTTNIALVLTNWASAGAAVETSPGHYQFTNITTNIPQGFYGIRSP
jgi:hypothetical protein